MSYNFKYLPFSLPISTAALNFGMIPSNLIIQNKLTLLTPIDRSDLRRNRPNIFEACKSISLINIYLNFKIKSNK